VRKLTKLTVSGKLFQTLTTLHAKKFALTLTVHLGLYNVMNVSQSLDSLLYYIFILFIFKSYKRYNRWSHTTATKE